MIPACLCISLFSHLFVIWLGERSEMAQHTQAHILTLACMEVYTLILSPSRPHFSTHFHTCPNKNTHTTQKNIHSQKTRPQQDDPNLEDMWELSVPGPHLHVLVQWQTPLFCPCSGWTGGREQGCVYTNWRLFILHWGRAGRGPGSVAVQSCLGSHAGHPHQRTGAQGPWSSAPLAVSPWPLIQKDGQSGSRCWGWHIQLTLPCVLVFSLLDHDLDWLLVWFESWGAMPTERSACSDGFHMKTPLFYCIITDLYFSFEVSCGCMI